MAEQRVRRLLPEPGAPRVLAVSTLVNTFGNGLFYTISALFLTRSVGLSVHQVGLALTIGGAVGLLANVPAGRIAEIAGPRGVLVAVNVLAAAFMASYVFVHSFAAAALVACGDIATTNAASAVRNGLIATAVPSEARVRTRAQLRSVTNVGIGLGSAVAALALASDSRAAYVSMILLDAVTYFAGALLVLRLPKVAPLPRRIGDGPQLVAIRDRPYLAVVALVSVVTTYNGLLEVAVPLWIVRDTSAPRVTVAVILVLNTAVCVLLQVRASRGVDDIRSGGRALRRFAGLMFLACLAFAAASGRPEPVAIVVLVVAALLHVTGELLASAGSWAYGYGLAPDRLQAQYQGLFSLSQGVAGMLAPIVVTSLVVTGGRPGWLVMGLLLAGAGMALGPVGRWAEANRPPVPAHWSGALDAA